MKLFVEMDEERYEKYKQFLNGELVSKKIEITKFLEETNFTLTNTTKSNDIVSGRNFIQKNYERDDIQVVVKVWGDNYYE